MADKPKNDLPKVPPFIIEGKSGKVAHEPVSQPRQPNYPPKKKKYARPSERGMLSVAILLISSISLGIAMTGGAWIALSVLSEGLESQTNLFPKILVVGLTYLVGWILGLFGVRTLGNVLLPYFIKAYAWFTLAGICILQIAVISKLFKQAYSVMKFNAYLLMFGAGLLALIGLHLIVEKHNLVPFSFPILFISLAHLYLIVFHYIFVPEEQVKYEFLWGDVIFFFITAAVSILMLAHFGMLNSFRNRIDAAFNQNGKHFVPPS